MRPILIPTIIGLVLGGLAGYAALQSRASILMGDVAFEGWAGIGVVAGITGGLGLLVGIILWLLIRTIKTASEISKDK